MLGKLRLLAGISGFVVVSAILSAVMEHFYADVVYAYKLREDWSWIRTEGDIGFFYSWSDAIWDRLSAVVPNLFVACVAWDKVRGSGRKFILSAVLLLELALILGTTHGVASLFTILALIQYIIYLLPVLLLNFFLGVQQTGRETNLRPEGLLIQYV